MAVSRQTLAELRFGCGFRPDRPAPAGPEDLLRQIAAPPRGALVDEAEARRRYAIQDGFVALRRRAKQGDADAARRFEQTLAEGRRMTRDDALARLARAATTPDGFVERLHRFWCGHFAVARRNPRHGAFILPMQELAIRPHLTGRFADMLIAATKSPAMLFYLDQSVSAGPNSRMARRNPRRGLNENLAREILELHTLGVHGPYDQRDVRDFARLLAGWSHDAGGFRFRENMAEPGEKTVLGRRWRGMGPEGAEEALRMLADHPATARRLAFKMARHFVSDAPPAPLVDAMARAYAGATGGDLGAMTRAMIAHELAWTDRARLGPAAKVKKPWDLVVSTLRAAGAQEADLAPGGPFGPPLTIRALEGMGQPIDSVPGPDGWKEEADAWITPGGLAARLDWAGRIGRVIAARTDPRDFARVALRDALGRETAFAVSAAGERWEAVALLLVSPDFNRR
ncbi:DUF1800 domain-containing protein [Oceanicella actignis]|uniref:DUF1800 domain-containing protein n=1 Tax=Oceanicella actignis TaxID=1189325 RepID=UPI0011E79427|nr:DUF1800 domain-containing protein [Oceanicella actignis]TYO89463.1 uncharacterized protein (DUF1800 family) [Oceanicella actignis]